MFNPLYWTHERLNKVIIKDNSYAYIYFEIFVKQKKKLHNVKSKKIDVNIQISYHKVPVLQAVMLSDLSHAKQ